VTGFTGFTKNVLLKWERFDGKNKKLILNAKKPPWNYFHQNHSASGEVRPDLCNLSVWSYSGGTYGIQGDSRQFYIEVMEGYVKF